jgi:hypothetical protein
MINLSQNAGHLTLEIIGVLGAATMFRQWGALRIVFPREMQDRASTKLSLGRTTYVFVQTDKGLLLCPIKEAMSNEEIKKFDLKI